MKPHNAIKLLESFRDFCVFKGKDIIVHKPPGGQASWNVCAVGQFADSKKSFKGTAGRGNHMYDKLLKAYSAVDITYGLGSVLYNLGCVRIAELHYPTFNKLAKALTKDIEVGKANIKLAKILKKVTE